MPYLLIVQMSANCTNLLQFIGFRPVLNDPKEIVFGRMNKASSLDDSQLLASSKFNGAKCLLLYKSNCLTIVKLQEVDSFIEFAHINSTLVCNDACFNFAT